MSPVCSHLRICLLLCVSLSLSLVSCSLLGHDEREPEDIDWIALTAVYDEVNDSGAPIQRIVLVNFDDPSEYRVLTPDTITAAVRPRVSPNGNKIVFEHHITGLGSRPWITLVDRDTGNVQPLYIKAAGDERGDPVLGTVDGFVWAPDGSGFYAAVLGPAGMGSSVYYYDLAGEFVEPLHERRIGATVIPYGLKGRDSLLVLSNDELATGDSLPGFYFMDAESGEYLEHINNEHLRFVPKKDHSWERSPHHPSYNAELNLIAFEMHDDASAQARPTGINHTARIAVTDLSGKRFQVFPSGEYVDRYPRWGPDGTILFDRVQPGSPGGWKDYRVMALDLETGTVRELFDPKDIDGAAGLRHADH